MRVLTAIPVFNEAQYVRGVLTEVRRLTADVLVIDDGSTDDTRARLAEIPDIDIIRHCRNQGYGQSLIDAFAYAQRHRYDWIITMDCDEQHEPQRIPAFIERAERDDVDIISGSRYLQTMAGNTDPPADRRRINRTITQLINDRLGLSLTDAFCGFKAHRVSAMARLELTETGYAFPMPFWVQAAHRGLRMTELPVQLIYNDPNRYFGGKLDDPEARLAHYLSVFDDALAKVGARCLEATSRCAAIAPAES